MPNSEKLSEVTAQNDVGRFNRLKHTVLFALHLWMPEDDVLPAFVSQANRHAMNRNRRQHLGGGAPYVVLSYTTALLGRSAFGLTSWSRSRSGRVMVGVGPGRSACGIMLTVCCFNGISATHAPLKLSPVYGPSRAAVPGNQTASTTVRSDDLAPE
jgi:hypothetical protein